MPERNIALISEFHLKNASFVELNTDSKILSKLVMDAQKLFLRPVLGVDLYNQVIEEVYLSIQDNDHVFNPDLKELLDTYIQPYLIYATLCDFIVVNQYKITNKGLLKINDSNATTISPDELSFAKNQFDNKSSAYKGLLIEYLKVKKLIGSYGKTDTDTTSDSIGWHLEGFSKI